MSRPKTMADELAANLSERTATRYAVLRRVEEQYLLGKNPRIRKTYRYSLSVEREIAGETRSHVFFAHGTTYRHMVRFLAAITDMLNLGMLDRKELLTHVE